MKKLIMCMLALVLAFSMTACGSNKDADESKEPSSSESVTSETESKETESSEKEESTEPSSEAEKPAASADIADAATETTADKPAALGQWVKSTRYSTESGKYETIYWRVTGTTFDCQADIDRYHAEDHLVQFQELEDEDLSYCKVSYEVYFPETFPMPEYGTSSPELSISATNPDGGGIEYKGVAYIGLGSSHDISVEQEIHPGDTFKGEAIYAMINDPSVNYVFEYSHTPEGQESGDLIYDYVASK